MALWVRNPYDPLVFVFRFTLLFNSSMIPAEMVPFARNPMRISGTTHDAPPVPSGRIQHPSLWSLRGFVVLSSVRDHPGEASLRAERMAPKDDRTDEAGPIERTLRLYAHLGEAWLFWIPEGQFPVMPPDHPPTNSGEDPIVKRLFRTTCEQSSQHSQRQ